MIQLRTRTWVAISVLCFFGAWYFWHLGEEKFRSKSGNQSNNRPAASLTGTNLSNTGSPKPLLVNAAVAGAALDEAKPPDPNVAFKYRLSNTTKKIGELTRSDQAILLRNALID